MPTKSFLRTYREKSPGIIQVESGSVLQGSSSLIQNSHQKTQQEKRNNIATDAGAWKATRKKFLKDTRRKIKKGKAK